MKKQKTRNIARGAALLSMAMPFLAAQPALAQSAQSTAPADSDATKGGLEEVIVTARRVQESEQHVPIAILSVSAEQLESQHIYDARSLMQQIPGMLQATRITGNPVPTSLTRVRGATGIANYFDDIPYPGAEWTFYAPYFDTQSVQVLKGPQGTLFGQASNSGAILIQPNRPGEKFAGTLSVQTGNYNEGAVEGALDIPLVSDHVFLRVAGKVDRRDGWATDVFSGVKNGKEDYDIERATLVIKPTANFQNETMLQFEHMRDLGQTVWTPGDYDFLNTSASQATLNGMTTAQWAAARDQILAQQAALGPYKIQGWSQGCPASALSPQLPSTVPGPNVNSTAQSPCGYGYGGYAKDMVVVNKTTWDFATDFSLKNLISNTKGGNNVAAVDLDGSRLILQDGGAKGIGLWQNYPTTWSEELQLDGKLFKDRLDFVSGAFYYDQKLEMQPNPTWAINNANTPTNGASESRSWAVYSQGNYKLTDKLTFTGGLRYTHDYAYALNVRLDPNTLAVAAVTSGGRGTPSGEASWTALTYTASLQYQLNPRTMFYLTNAKGYSSGGLQNVPGLFKFNPDSLNNFELGVKSTFDVGSNWQVRPDLSVYYGLYNDVKITTGFFTTIPGTTTTQVVIATTNGAKATISGFDFDMLAAYSNLFNLRASVSYVHPKYTEYFGRVTQLGATAPLQDLSNSPFPNTPPWKYGLSGTFHLPMNAAKYGQLSLTAQYTHTSMYWVTYGKPMTPYVAGNPDTGAVCRAQRTAANGYGPLAADGKWAYKDCAPANENLNLTLTWANPMGHDGMQASLAVTNVTRESRPVGISSGYDTANWNAAYSQFPLFIYATLKQSF